MKRVALAGILILCILLSGCGVLGQKDYVWMDTHPIPTAPVGNQSISAADYEELYAALVALVEEGSPQTTISVERYNQNNIEPDMQRAVDAVCKDHPIAAYAVEKMEYTLGTAGGERVLAVTISYLHDQSEIKRIKTVSDIAAAEKAVTAALVACDTGIVLQIVSYEEKDFDQLVKDYALTYPESVMEVPQVTVNVFPDAGKTRVVELKFTYQSSRESLKNMQAQVENLFKSAQFFASGYRSEEHRFMRLYTWLMETNEYTIQTSITPAYSLLRYGTGDSKAFATVYASLCRRMGLDCLTVSGARDGESWYWNLIQVEGEYYHLDLLHCSGEGDFQMRTDSEMKASYVWDYDAYPVSPAPESPTPLETTVPQEPASEG